MSRPMGESLSQRAVGVVGFLLRLLGCAAVIALSCAFSVVYEATPVGPGRVWMWGAGLFLLPVLYFLEEALPNPILQDLEGKSWWRDAPSSIRVIIGVLVVLPFFVFLIAIAGALRQWLGVEGW